MCTGGCTVARTVSALVYLLYSIYIFTYFHKRKRRKKKKEKKKKPIEKCVANQEVRIFEDGHQLMYFFVGWGPHHNLFFSSFAFSPSAFRKELSWTILNGINQASRRMGWVGV